MVNAMKTFVGWNSIYSKGTLQEIKQRRDTMKGLTKAILHKEGQEPIEVYVHGENGTFIDTSDDCKVKRMIQVSKQFPSRCLFSARETELSQFISKAPRNMFRGDTL